MTTPTSRSPFPPRLSAPRFPLPNPLNLNPPPNPIPPLMSQTPRPPPPEPSTPPPREADTEAGPGPDPDPDPPAADGSTSSSDHPKPPQPPARAARFPRACTSRSAASRLYPPASPPLERRPTRKEREEKQQNSRIVTPLAPPLPDSPSQITRWGIRSMWQMASLLNFLHVFRPLLNIGVEFSAEELETALITPNSTLDDVHIPLLKAIPPVTRMALGQATWVTVLCRKLRDWWHWVADGEIPIVASHGAEVETYKTLDPATRVLILKALCDIRVEQEDIRGYIESSLKHGIQLSAFRRERIGGDSHGISYWYEDDPIIGHRLYREIRQVEVKKMKARGPTSPPRVSYQWETVATNLDEFQEVSDKLFSSKNRTEAALGKRLKIDLLPEIEKIHKKKERLFKKQQRQALLLDNYITADGLSTGRSLRDRKPVRYTFDDYDRSINEAIKITKKSQNSPENVIKKEGSAKHEPSTNGRWNGTSHASKPVSYETQSPKSSEYEETDGELQADPLDRSIRRRKRPQRYSEKDYVEAVSDNEADFDSDDDIVGEAVYDEEYLRIRKQKKVSSSSDGDEEYRGEENADEYEEEEEEEDDSLSVSDEDTDDRHQYKKRTTRSRRGAKLRSVDELQSGLRRSKRSTRPRVNYRQYELSETDAESEKADKSNASDAISDASNDMELSTASQDSEDHEIGSEETLKDEKMNEESPDENVEKDECQPIEKPKENPGEGVRKRRFLDLNELAPGTGFEDGPNTMMKDDDTDNL